MTSEPPHVAGIDTGLVCTAVATAGRTARVVKIGRTGITKLPLGERTDAIVDLGLGVVDLIYLRPEEMPGMAWMFRKPGLVLIEAPDVSNAFGGLVERIQLYHEIVRSLSATRISYGIVPSAILKGYATGNGGVDKNKKRVKAAVAQLWPEYGKVNDDQADGIVLAAMGLDKLTGHRRVPDAQAEDWLNRPSIQWSAEIRRVG